MLHLQELVEGSSLAQMVEAGWKPSNQEVERIAAELLSTLAYLQKQQVHKYSVLAQACIVIFNHVAIFYVPQLPNLCGHT